jgi:hypothetical protein
MVILQMVSKIRFTTFAGAGNMPVPPPSRRKAMLSEAPKKSPKFQQFCITQCGEGKLMD